MTFKKKINTVRRFLMKQMTSNVGISSAGGSSLLKRDRDIKVLIIRPNHRLGNLLLITPLLEEIATIFPDAKIDLFVKGNLGKEVFKNFANVNQVIQLPKKPFSDLWGYIKGWLAIRSGNYTLVINVINSSSSGRLSARFSDAQLKYYGEEDDNADNHMAKYPVYGARKFLKEAGVPVSYKAEVPNLDIKLGTQELAKGKELLQQLVKNARKTIGLFTYATGDKIYSKEWWGDFYNRLKLAFPDYNIVEVLPVENCSQIEFKAPTFSDGSVRVVGSFIANLDLFIAADSGMMHLGGAAQATTIGLFKVTNMTSYEPYNGMSVAIDTTTTNLEECIEIVRSRLAVQVAT
jgi:heptosyltransferase-3